MFVTKDFTSRYACKHEQPCNCFTQGKREEAEEMHSHLPCFSRTFAKSLTLRSVSWCSSPAVLRIPPTGPDASPQFPALCHGVGGHLQAWPCPWACQDASGQALFAARPTLLYRSPRLPATCLALGGSLRVCKYLPRASAHYAPGQARHALPPKAAARISSICLHLVWFFSLYISSASSHLPCLFRDLQGCSYCKVWPHVPRQTFCAFLPALPYASPRLPPTVGSWTQVPSLPVASGGKGEKRTNWSFYTSYSAAW